MILFLPTSILTSAFNWVLLHEAWQNRLSSYALSKDFYREIADWYFWAHHQANDGVIQFPQHCDTEGEKSLLPDAPTRAGHLLLVFSRETANP